MAGFEVAGVVSDSLRHPVEGVVVNGSALQPDVTDSAGAYAIIFRRMGHPSDDECVNLVFSPPTGASPCAPNT